MSARRRPPKVKDGAKEVQGKDIAPVVKKTEGIILDGAVDEVSRDLVNDGLLVIHACFYVRRKRK